MPSDVSVSRQEIADLARDPHTTDEKFWFTMGALWIGHTEFPTVEGIEEEEEHFKEKSLQWMYDEMVQFVGQHMSDVPLPDNPETLSALGVRIGYSIDLLRSILTVTADYHHTKGRITSLVGFMMSVANNTTFTSIHSQAQAIRQKWKKADETPTGSMDTQAEQKAEEYVEKKQVSKTIDLSARLKQKQEEKAARLGLVDD